LVLLFLIGCAELSLPAGDWLAGDLHVHSSLGSNDTDGLGTEDALGPAMQRAGLDWLVMTDHSNATGSMHCEDVEDCPNLGPEGTLGDWPDGVFFGSEISPVTAMGAPSDPTGHVGCVARDGASFPGLDAFVDRPTGEVSGGDAIEQCLAVGGFAILNHPFGPAPWVAFDWTSEAYEAMEVYNGGARFDASDAKALERWEADLAQGRNLIPVGGSDAHKWGQTDPEDLLSPPLGWPATWVHVREGEGPLDALFAGRVVIAEPGSHLRVVAQNRSAVVGPGERIEGPVDLHIEASTEALDRVLQLRQIGEGTLQEWPIGKSAFEVDMEVDTGIYYVRIYPEGEIQLAEPGVALSAAIFVD
jgi:hypothetical protein